jgi:hypothetical protein
MTGLNSAALKAAVDAAENEGNRLGYHCPDSLVMLAVRAYLAALPKQAEPSYKYCPACGCALNGWTCENCKATFGPSAPKQEPSGEPYASEEEYTRLAKRCNQLEYLVGQIAMLLRKDMTSEDVEEWVDGANR